MALPLKRIKKIKLNDNTTYDIVPESLEKNGHQAALPDLSVDSTIAMTSDLPTKQSLDLGNVDNTSDLNKPVSTATQTALDAKQATLVSGTNIKTINNESVLGSGNLEIEGRDIEVVASLPTTFSDDTVYLSDTNAATEGGIVEFPIPTVADAGKAFVIDSTGAVALGEAGGGGGLTETTWSALKTLRDGGNLTPGAFYRITDYQCTTLQENTSSANHQFDIIVLALENNKLSEEAWAAHHAGDTYFANSKLEAWRIWYCLDNDATRFGWALIPRAAYIEDTNSGYQFYRNDSHDDPTRGFGFKASYDPSFWIFTDSATSPTTFHYYAWYGGDYWQDMGVMTSCVYHPAVTIEGKGVIYRMIDEFNNDVQYDFKNVLLTSSGKYTNAYTFSYTEDGVIKDASLLGQSGGCYSNIMKGNSSSIKFNMFYSTSTFLNCHFNTFGSNCASNTFGSNCTNNTFGSNCTNNTFDSDCTNNTFGNGCYSNTFGSNCASNTFDSDCTSNTFGNSCHFNTFDSNCASNTFGSNCTHNTFGSNCTSNTFGSGCFNNTFDSDCTHNTFGSDCTNNTFGSDCDFNTFGTSSSTITYCRYIILDNGCSGLYINSADTTASYSNQLQNVHIHAGVRDANSGGRRTITVPDRNLAYSTDYYANGSQTVILD